jgi:hypothetical protein
MLKKSSVYILTAMTLLLVSCSFFIGRDADEFKSDHYSLNFSQSNWKSISADDSDYAFMKEESKSIIFINSFCKKHDATTLDHLVSHLLSGIEDLKVEEKLSYSLFGREAIQAKANGKLDGVQSYFQMYVVNKNRCTYDFILISSSPEVRANDAKDLLVLIEGVKIE